MLLRRSFLTLNFDRIIATRTALWRAYSDTTGDKEKEAAVIERFDGRIPMDKISTKFCRSSGPGGMNVNTLNTKVELRFEVRSAEWIPPTIRENMLEKLDITKSGHLVITSDKTRTQEDNMKDALEKLREVIKSCEPKVQAELSPQLLAKLQKRKEKAARERLNVKRIRSNIKGSRGAV